MPSVGRLLGFQQCGRVGPSRLWYSRICRPSRGGSALLDSYAQAAEWGSGSGISALSRRQLGTSPWVNLGAFAVSGAAQQAWRELKALEGATATLCEKYAKSPEIPDSPTSEIDWAYWYQTIQHPPLVDCLKTVYEQRRQTFAEALQSIAAEGAHAVQSSNVNGSAQTASQAIEERGWRLYTRALEECRDAITASEELVADGARTLWVSAQNPNVTEVATEEWLDSDRYWQAYMERHHHFDPAKDTDAYHSPSGTFEDATQDAAYRKEWLKKTNLFHDRSDTPTLYSYMDQLYSSDYYDIYRRVFLEHMLYFLIRTGNSRHFFPQIPPVEWIVDMERLRYAYISKAHERRCLRQAKTLKREEPLDFCPPDSEMDHAEDHFKALLSREKAVWEEIVAKWMGDYIFLCYPAIPCQSEGALLRAVSKDAGRGAFYTLGNEVGAIFYVPENARVPFRAQEGTPENSEMCESITLCRPRAIIEGFKAHIAATGGLLHPAYGDILSIHAEILEKRGTHWLVAPGECVADAFLRRLPVDDPQRVVFVAYVEELKEKWRSCQKMTFQQAVATVNALEARNQCTQTVFDTLRSSVNVPSESFPACLEYLTEAYLSTPDIALVDKKTSAVLDAETMKERIELYATQKRCVSEALASSKLPVLKSHKTGLS